MFSERARLDGAHVVALVEFLEVELLHGACAPQPQRVHRVHPVSGNWCVEWRGQHVLRVDPVVGEAAALVRGALDAAKELHAEAVTGPRNLPGITVAEPAVRNLYLHTVHDPLMEDAVVLAEAVAVTRVPERGEGVDEAGGKAPQAAVAQARVPFRLPEIFEPVTELGHCLSACVAQAHGHEAVAEGPSHKV